MRNSSLRPQGLPDLTPGSYPPPPGQVLRARLAPPSDFGPAAPSTRTLRRPFHARPVQCRPPKSPPSRPLSVESPATTPAAGGTHAAGRAGRRQAGTASSDAARQPSVCRGPDPQRRGPRLGAPSARPTRPPGGRFGMMAPLPQSPHSSAWNGVSGRIRWICGLDLRG